MSRMTAEQRREKELLMDSGGMSALEIADFARETLDELEAVEADLIQHQRWWKEEIDISRRVTEERDGERAATKYERQRADAWWERCLKAEGVAKQAMEALDFYAQEENHTELCFNNPEGLPYGPTDDKVGHDSGRLARLALDSISESREALGL